MEEAFAPQRTSGSVWGCFGLNNLGGKGKGASGVERAETRQWVLIPSTAYGTAPGSAGSVILEHR